MLNNTCKLKVITVVGTRPEIIRLSRIIEKFDIFFNHYLVHTGQNYDYELKDIFFEQLNIRKPDYFLNTAGETPSKTIGNIIIKVDEILEELNPDVFVILGDTNSALSSIAAKKRKIPIFHLEAGNRCFNDIVPEEINRRIVDHISDINLTYSQIARQYLIKEGLKPQQIIVIGSPMREVLNFHKKDISKSDILKKLELNHNEYYLVSLHREENVDDKEKLLKIYNILSFLYEREKYPVILSTHPRTKKNLEKFNFEINKNKSLIFAKPFGFLDYIKLQINSKCVLSDSGTLTEESSILGFDALNLREEHERPEGCEEGSVMMTGLDINRISNALDFINLSGIDRDYIIKAPRDYLSSNISYKLVKLIYSYTNYVKKYVWRKS